MLPVSICVHNNIVSENYKVKTAGMFKPAVFKRESRKK